VRGLEDKISVNAQLISTETGAHVWADRFDGERSKLGELQVEFVSRLANSLGVELVKAESLRAMRERPNNPDATDLAMRAEALWSSSDVSQLGEVMNLFERALVLDPHNLPAMTGLAGVLQERVTMFASKDPSADIARADELINAALALQPDNSWAHFIKGWLFFAKRQFGPATAEAETAIAEDPNYADAHAALGFFQLFLGHSEKGFASVERALRLSPRDPGVPFWQFFMCHLHSHLAQWEHAIEWCSKSTAGDPTNFFPLVDLTAANAWLGHAREAKEAAAQLQKVYPGFTVQTWAGHHFSDDPTFDAQFQRVLEGLRKAGLPEGEKKTD
jgi:adenylate cyclase